MRTIFIVAPAARLGDPVKAILLREARVLYAPGHRACHVAPNGPSVARSEVKPTERGPRIGRHARIQRGAESVHEPKDLLGERISRLGRGKKVIERETVLLPFVELHGALHIACCYVPDLQTEEQDGARSSNFLVRHDLSAAG
jgi:hypothetical protein